MIKVLGKFGISAKVLCDSISQLGIRITTFELEYPRIVHAEFMTHCMFARNAASSRAIPAAKMREQLTARPVRFGKNVSGMQDLGQDYDAPVDVGHALGLSHEFKVTPEEAWNLAKDYAVDFSTAFAEAGYHKQVFNRLTEAFQMIKVVCTATEFNNFFWLRNDGAADPTIHELARCMKEAREQSIPAHLLHGDWHLPYVGRFLDENNVLRYGDGEDDDDGHFKVHVEYALEDAIKVSAARCAAVSFRNVDYGLEKCREVHARLVGDARKHSSAMEHQATPMHEEYIGDYITVPTSGPYDAVAREMLNVVDCPHTWEKGITHVDRNGQLWSAKFRGFIQYRKLIDGENVEG